VKALMFGWEFPPHISGGLGTACHGLTRGLAHHGVEVLFVVPRAFGDEDKRFASVIGANEVSVLEESREVVRAAAGEPGFSRRLHEGATEIVGEDWTRIRELVRTLAIESPLMVLEMDV